MLPPSRTPPTRAALRKLLAAVLKVDSELDAFCLDCFFQVKQRYFSQGMPRIVKTNLLLEFADPEELFTQLERHFPDEVAARWESLQEEPRVARAARRLQELRVERERLEQARQTLIQHGIQPQLLADIDAKLLTIRREQRHGPLLNEGELVANRYSIMQRLGQGGFATVWLAYDRLGEPHIGALKVMHGQFAKDQTYIDRFQRGARKMAELVHDHIVPVLAGPEWDNDLGLPYFVMPYLAGGDLRDAVLRHELSRAEALQAVRQVGEALEYAHSRGLVHRDVKPQNILVDLQGRAYLTDFDLVLGQDNTFVSRTGQGAGSVTYAAPEQLQNSKLVDQRADVYSLAMTALFVLRGEDLPPTAMAQTDSFIAELKYNDEVKRALARALKWLPAERTQSAVVFCRELQDALEQPELQLVDSEAKLLSGPEVPIQIPDCSSAPPTLPDERPQIPASVTNQPTIIEDSARAFTIPPTSVLSASRGWVIATAPMWRPTRWIVGVLASGLLVYLVGSFLMHFLNSKRSEHAAVPASGTALPVSGHNNGQPHPEPPTSLSAASAQKPEFSRPAEAVSEALHRIDVAASPSSGGAVDAGLSGSQVKTASSRRRAPRFVDTFPAPALETTEASDMKLTTVLPPQSGSPASLNPRELYAKNRISEAMGSGLLLARAGGRDWWLIVGMAACKLGVSRTASEAYDAATPAERIQIATECFAAGYRWINGEFRLPR
jgi:serine/threonine protein kinase